MRNPFPAIFAYMLTQTVMSFPIASSLVFGAIVLVGWAMALNELMSLARPDELQEATYLD